MFCLFTADHNSESESQTGNSGSEDNTNQTVPAKDTGKNNTTVHNNGTVAMNTLNTVNGSVDKTSSGTPSKEAKIIKLPSATKKTNTKKARHR